MTYALTEEPPIRWVDGDQWPKVWEPRPTFARCFPGGLRLVEVVNSSWMIERMNYPRGPRIPVPDKLGKAASGDWLLWEEKSKDAVNPALRQLTDGLRILRSLGQPVTLLGLSLEKFDPKEGWTTSPDGYLVKRWQLGPATPYEISALKVMVEARGR